MKPLDVHGCCIFLLPVWLAGKQASQHLKSKGERVCEHEKKWARTMALDWQANSRQKNTKLCIKFGVKEHHSCMDTNSCFTSQNNVCPLLCSWMKTLWSALTKKVETQSEEAVSG